jgi:hypothetical protein
MCECLDWIVPQLEKLNAGLDCPIRIDRKTGKQLPYLPKVTLFKLDSRKRGPLPVLLCQFCPFCGEPYDSGEKDSEDGTMVAIV